MSVCVLAKLLAVERGLNVVLPPGKQHGVGGGLRSLTAFSSSLLCTWLVKPVDTSSSRMTMRFLLGMRVNPNFNPNHRTIDHLHLRWLEVSKNMMP